MYMPIIKKQKYSHMFFNIYICMIYLKRRHIYIYDREAFRVYSTYAFCIKHMKLFIYFK